jgi:MFS family permease
MSEIPTFLLGSLQFQNARTESLRKVSDAEWEQVLTDWRLVRLAFPLREVCGDDLPRWVRERIDIFRADNELRFERIKKAYILAAQAFLDAGADHVVLKGFSLGRGYTDHPIHRPQSDIDLYCPPDAIFRARAALFALGYTTEPDLGQESTEHLPALIPSQSWKWRGNHFDPDMPVSFEFHFSLWDSTTRRIYPEGLGEFWSRRQERVLDNLCFPAFEPVDNLAYTALNLLRNLLGSYPAAEQVYCLARFLHTQAHDRLFWQRWRDLHPDSLRRLEAVSFHLASECFGCRLSEEAREEVNRLAPPIHQFFRHFSKSTLSTRFGRIKDGLWLHLDLLETRADKSAILFQQLVPIGLATHRSVAGDERTLENAGGKNLVSRVPKADRELMEYAKWFVTRGFYHVALLPVRLWSGLCYRLSRKNLGRQFWTFFAASFCFDLGMTMYFFLYNLYLLDCGFKEKFLGLTMSTMNIGSIACTIPAGVLIQRLGIRKSLLICIALVSAVSAARALFAPQSAVLVLALLGGFLTTIWAVAISPAIALLTDEKSRPFGFSLVFSSGIGLGIFANLAASRLPGFFMRLRPALTEVQGKQIVLLIASAIVAMALIPLSMLQIDAPAASNRKLYPRNPFLWRFLPALALWSLVTGSLSPLANVYFSQYLHTSLARMGIIFSFSNLLQVLGILVAPFLFRKLGLVSGVACTQLAAALLLGLLAASSGALPSAFIYVGFTGFLWMSEPGLFSLLMSGVAPDERAGASALNFLVISLVQAVAVAATGTAFTRFGYPSVLGTIALFAMVAAVAFWGLLGRNVLPATNSAPIDSNA